MKKILYILLLLPLGVLAQTTTENHVVSKSYKIKTTSVLTTQNLDSATIAIQYFDGLGRAKQSIIVKGGYDTTSGQAKDIVTHYSYDALGRQAKEFLPYLSSNSDGSINTGAELATQSYYQTKYADDFTGITNTTDINAYSEKLFENSPLNRVFEQTAPGEAWKKGSSTVTGEGYSNGHSIKLNHDTNLANEVRYYWANTTLTGDVYTPSLVASGNYNAGELYKTITKDENWTEGQTHAKDHTTEEFQNAQGQVILKRTYDTNIAHDTYYVYDDYGNLTYVFPPKVITSDGVSATELDELGYQYKYDTRNRLVEKKIPGKGWEYIVYDTLDRPILTQDALQRNSNKWLFTKYDALGRVIYTGTYTDSGSRTSVQTAATNASSVNESYNSVYVPGTLFYYTNTAFPTNITFSDVYTINYYDEYVYWGGSAVNPITTVYGTTLATNAKGLPTTSKVKVLGTSNWITTITGYDDKARPIYAYSKNEYLQTTDIVESNLDFVGKVLEVKATHQKTGETDIVTFDSFEYDHQDRLIAQSQKVNNQISERIVRNNYDELGQLESKLTGNGAQKGYTDVTSGITINNDVITKTGAIGWNAGLATLGSFQADGYVEFTATQDNKLYSVGLSKSNLNVSYASTEFAIYLYTHKKVVIHESGSSFNPFETYEIGDVFRIERIGDKIHYKKNGKTIYISTKTSTGTLLGDVALNYPNSQIKNLHIVDNSKGLQNVDYDYNVRGWLKTINDDVANDNDLFNFKLNYNQTDISGSTPLYNGNISETVWSTANDDSNSSLTARAYSYQYDALNRITKGLYKIKNTSGVYTDLNYGNYRLKNISYDKNGNILTLKRTGSFYSTEIDNLIYTYDNGNKLLKVVDNGSTYNNLKDEGFKDGTNTGNDYTYDANGNMISDANKGITSITYNHLNLPTYVSVASSSNGGGNIQYIYDATGVKQRKIAYSWVGGTTTTDYAGNHIYEDNTLQFFNHAEGYVSPELVSGSVVGWNYVYQYKDHLGNVRLTYSDSDENGQISASAEIIEESNYYPFGLKHKGYNNVVSSNGNSTAQKFGFTGKEHQDELGLGWIDITARNYDAALGRWMNLDPLAEQMRRHSPYNYAFDNPIYFIDPDGMMPEGGDQEGDPGDGLIKKAQKAAGRIFSSFFNFLSVNSGLDKKIQEVKNKGEKTEYVDKLGNDKSDAAIELGKSIEENSGDVVIGMTYAAGDALDKGGSEVAEKATLTTISTGGLSSEVTVPLAGAASTASGIGKFIKGSVLFFTGNEDAAVDEGISIVTDYVTGKVGSKASDKLVDSKKITKGDSNILGAIYNFLTSKFLK